MSEQSNNKTIVKNTLLLYVRMMLTMVVSLYTSRVILEYLGLDDYGIYQAVGGIVGFLSFINGALGGGSSRFLTYALGENDFEKLKKTFSTTLTIHIALASIILVAAEIGGWWFLHNKMVIPADRMIAAEWVFQLSLIAAFFSLTQIPYSASIISHEKMGVYAYVSIAEVTIKLAIVYALTLTSYDKLIFYAVLLCLATIGFQIFYRIYCGRNFKETHYELRLYDKQLLKEIGAFSGWQLFAQGSIALNSQGVLILLNMFFSPAVVAARAISLQVNGVANQFVQNFRTAANPQIVKKYAAGDIAGSKRLLLSSTKYSYYMMLLISLPICLLAEPLLTAWLRVVPEYTVIFLQIAIIQSLFQVFDTSLYTAIYAKGKVKWNALTSPTIGLLQFPIIYLFFKWGFSPIALSISNIVVYAILGLIQKPVLILKLVEGYSLKEILRLYMVCIKVTFLSLPLPILANSYFDHNTIPGFCAIGFICVLNIAIVTWTIGIDRDTRNKVKKNILSRIKK